MPQDARIGDIGVGWCHCHDSPPVIPMSGIIITGSPNVRSNSIPTARLFDVVMGFCGHTGILITASGNVRANSINSSRLGDAFTGCFKGTIVTGSPNVREGG